MRAITIRGAREHNLKNVDIDIPRDKLVVLTGLSGSGKSSLAFDTIYAEGQRRYVESLSAYARQFLEMMQKPDVDQIDGLSPAISIEQKTTSKNPRSTVGTVTEIYDYMRLLWARVGVPYSPATGLPIESQTVSQMVDRVLALPEGTRLYLLAPVVRGRKGEYRKELAEYLKKGFQRVKIDGTFHEIAEAPALDKKFPHDIDVVVDRIVVRPDIGQRLAESFETALKLAEGLAVIEYADAPAGPDGDEEAGKVRQEDRKNPRQERAGADPVLGEIRLPGVRLHHSRNRAAAVLVQQSLWRLPGLRRSRRRAAYRRGPGHSRQGADLAQGRDRALGEVVLALLHADADRRSANSTSSRSTPSGRTCRRRRRPRSCTAPARTRSSSPTRTACAPTTPRSRSRASSPIIERRFRETESEWAREELGKYFSDVPCDGLPRLPAEAGGAVRQDRRQAYRRDLRTVGAAAPANGSRPCRRRSTPSRTRSPPAS